MMPRFPLVPTFIVGVAVAAMIALGFWQLLVRKPQKEAELVQLAENFDKPAIAFPRNPVGNEYLFRHANALCLEPTGWLHEGASNGNYRVIAECRTGAEGPVLLVDIGVSRDPRFTPNWKGGAVTGWITHAPDHRPLIVTIFGTAPKMLMLIADQPAAGLKADEKPSLDSVPNNHLAYAVQWFLFALVAAVIYVLALRQRQKAAPTRIL